MPTVTPHYRDQANDLFESLRSTTAQWEETAMAAGSAIQSVEDDMLTAFSFTGNSSDQSKIDELAKKYNLKGANGSSINAQGLQIALQSRYERVTRSLALLSELIEKAGQAAQRIISKIGS